MALKDQVIFTNFLNSFKFYLSATSIRLFSPNARDHTNASVTFSTVSHQLSYWHQILYSMHLTKQILYTSNLFAESSNNSFLQNSLGLFSHVFSASRLSTHCFWQQPTSKSKSTQILSNLSKLFSCRHKLTVVVRCVKQDETKGMSMLQMPSFQASQQFWQWLGCKSSGFLVQFLQPVTGNEPEGRSDHHEEHSCSCLLSSDHEIANCHTKLHSLPSHVCLQCLFLLWYSDWHATWKLRIFFQQQYDNQHGTMRIQILYLLVPRNSETID